jgi:AcrR family transcriptional regulator
MPRDGTGSYEPTSANFTFDRPLARDRCPVRHELMMLARPATAQNGALVPRPGPHALEFRGGRTATIGSHSEKVRLRRRPIRRSSRFVCEAILEAFEKALASQSFESCTTNHIADMAGVGIGSFYEYFANKETVLAVWLHRHSSHLLADFDRLLDGTPRTDLGHQIEDIVRGVFDCYARKLHVWHRVAHMVYAISTDEQCERCTHDFADRWKRLFGVHFHGQQCGDGRIPSTAKACHELLLSHIESATLGSSENLHCPRTRQHSIDILLGTIHRSLGVPAR